MNPTILQIPYRSGWRLMFFDLFLLVMLIPISHMATNVHREIIFDGIPLSAGMVMLIGKILFVLIAIAVVWSAVEALYLILFRPSLQLTDSAVIVPRSAFRSKKIIPYNTIARLVEQKYSRRRTTYRSLGIQAPGKRAWIGDVQLPPGEYDRFKRLLEQKITMGRPLAGNRGMKPVVKTGTRADIKILGFLVVVGSGVAAGYELFFAGALEKTPTTVSTSDFDSHIPQSRYVVITGGTLDMRHAVKYQLFHSSNGNNPDESYFVPLVDPVGGTSEVPRVLLEISAEDVKKLGTGHPISIEGIRVPKVPGLEVPYGVRDSLQKLYGPAYDNLVLIDAKQAHFTRCVLGVAFGGLMILALTVALIMWIEGVWERFRSSRR